MLGSNESGETGSEGQRKGENDRNPQEEGCSAKRVFGGRAFGLAACRQGEEETGDKNSSEKGRQANPVDGGTVEHGIRKDVPRAGQLYQGLALRGMRFYLSSYCSC